MISDLVRLLRLGIICLEDLGEFSEELKEAVKFIVERA